MFFFDFPKSARAVDRVLKRGMLQMGTFANIDCANVEVGKRILRLVSCDSFLGIVGISTRGKDVLTSFGKLLTHPNIRTQKSERILNRLMNGYRLGKDSEGPLFVDDRVITDFCRLILELRRTGEIGGHYLRYAENCERFMVGLADVGLAAMIDEATGYAKSQKDEYQRLFLSYISEERTDWVKEFPDSFFDGIYKIYNLEKVGRNHPKFFGAFIAKYVYWPLADSRGAILKKLREKDPVVDFGGRQYKLHQFLTQEVGKKALHDHLVRIGTVLDLSKDKGSFKRYFQRAFPHAGDQLEFEFDIDV